MMIKNNSQILWILDKFALSMVADVGPMKVTPWFSSSLTNSKLLARRPFPGWTALAPDFLIVFTNVLGFDNPVSHSCPC